MFSQSQKRHLFHKVMMAFSLFSWWKFRAEKREARKRATGKNFFFVLAVGVWDTLQVGEIDGLVGNK
jgi:hypothetical protein